ncbi:dynamin-like 120 kDa protein, mitochondrial isoform X3 [Acropora millepora]|uniref:dynamin-like 120 kDa protein, mitochondrial isoform X3 n=1 Tax=Acropora millepora TaxID=45264 RepID=UPI001CF35B63|nr:dynamin-like 120 kDa protein, mitochondrial isoform X3 [Acropora millepora]
MLRVSGAFSFHCEHCLERIALQRSPKRFYGQKLLCQVTKPMTFNQRCEIHTLLNLRHRHIRTFMKTPLGIYPAITRVLINKNVNGERMVSTAIVRAVMRVARVRYLLLGATGAGGVTAKMTYDSWKDKWQKFQETLPEFSWLTELHMSVWDSLPDLSNTFEGEVSPSVVSAAVKAENSEKTSTARKTPTEKMQERLEKSQEELIEMQQRYQREIEKLERENRELRKQVIILKGDSMPTPRKIKKSLIDMYSDVLDLLSEYDVSYNTTDHLPRVVVVGDQSAGKTSVLEMIAQARIFPRGSGQMMTRAPVMVTLSEGPNHMAQFKGSTHQYDLTQENELKALRQEVEIRMRNSVKSGQTVSREVISLSVKGPGLHRMVLVDLPGIIGTITAGMAENTRDDIVEMSRNYMKNPNAIILCIQDGAIDAERSNVTDLVSKMDPAGKRTIFVLTKVDLAEQNDANPSRIKQILEGRLFPMKALGYFAVVTGTGNTNEGIDTIRGCEEEFFRNSKLFKSGVFKASQMTTQNLSFAVSHCFWKMVRESIEQQADSYKAKRFNLETEWKNFFPKLRELDRNELFDKARNEILDEVLTLSEITPQMWEDAITKHLWSAVAPHFIETIYLPAAQADNPSNFNTSVDIKLKQWADRTLPDISVKVGWETLFEEFYKATQEIKTDNGHSHLFEDLKAELSNECKRSHVWQTKAIDSLRVIQLTALEDWSVSEKQQWDSAIKFMENTLQDELDKASNKMYELLGPGATERWLYWKSRSREQQHRCYIKDELQRLLQANERHAPMLADDELTTVKKNLETINVEVSSELVNETWHHFFREYFLSQSLGNVQECRNAFYRRDLVKNELGCNDVVLFWRIQKMLQTTSNAIRQQVMNHEARRLEKEVKQVLEEISHDQVAKERLIRGRQVDLAEELKRVRHIQESLEQFIEALNNEK